MTSEMRLGIVRDMTEDQVRDKIRKLVNATDENVSRVARELGVSPQYLHDVLNGRRQPGKTILASLGIQKVVTYRAMA